MNPLTTLKRANKVNLAVAEKLRGLHVKLQNANNGFKRIAERCGNRKTQIVVFGLATESFQFYKEISSQIQVLEGVPSITECLQNEYNAHWDADQTDVLDRRNEVLDECSQIEKNLITEFRRLLNDSLISGDLRKLLQEQLNGFLYAFVKLKMLRDYSNATIEYGILF